MTDDFVKPTIEYSYLAPLLVVFTVACLGVLVEAFVPRKHRFLVQATLAARGVAVRRPVFRPAHRALRLAGFPEAERLWRRTLSIPCYPTLADVEVDTVAAARRAALA